MQDDGLAQPRSLSTIILAGGQSRRMGQDKALITIQGRPLLQRICQMALACTPQVVVVTPWPDRYQTIVPQGCQLIQEVPLNNLDLNGESHGPLVGFAQGLAHLQTNWVLLLACDLPQLQLRAVQGWMQQLQGFPDHSEAIALLPRHPKGWEPLCGFYRHHCLASLTAYIEQGGRSFQGWLAQQSVEELWVANRAVLWNCNTPADLAALPVD